MAAFPSLLLIFAAAWAGLLMAERRPWQTVGAVVGIGGCALTLLLLPSRLPLTTALSVWRPVELFGEGLLLVLDHAMWGCAMAICSLLLAALLSRVGQARLFEPGLAWSMLLAAFGLMAVLAGNQLTLIISWTFLGICRLSWRILAADGELEPVGLVQLGGQEIFPPLLLWTAALFNQFGGGSYSLFEPMRSQPGTLLLLLAVIARAAPPSIDWAQGTAPATTNPGLTLFQLVPATVAAACLGRVALSQPFTALAALGSWVGLLVFALGISGWLAAGLRAAATGRLAWGMVGLCVMLAGTGDQELMQAVTVALVLLVGLQSFAMPSQPWHRLWRGLACLAAAGLPGLPGAGVSEGLSQRLIVAGGPGWLGIVAAAAMVIVAAGLWPRPAASDPGVAGSQVRGIDLACLALVAIGVLISARYGWMASRSGLLLFGASSLAAAALVWLSVRPRWIWPQQLALARSSSTIVQHALAPLNSAAAVVRQVILGAAGLFEGRAGILWMLLILLVAWLALQA